MARPPLLPSILLTILTATTLGLTPTPGQAFTLQVNGVHHDITTFQGSYNDNPALFDLPSAGRMPWWGDANLAEEFAIAVDNSLPGNGGQGPFFAFAEDADFVTAAVLALNLPGSSSEVDIGKEERVVYAILKPQQPPTGVPAPMPIFGAAASFAWSRRLRARLRSGTHPGNSSRATASTSSN